MGVLRFYLAAAVIAWHTNSLGGYLPMTGDMAVEVFYLISGFYMALVLNTKYRGPGSYRVFFANRLLRVYPAYFLVMAVTFLSCLLGDRFLGHSRLSPYREYPLTPASWTYLVGINLTLVGQETPLFLDLLPDGSLAWPDFHDRHQPPLHLFMLVPQAWSLSLELMFYSVAPFLVRRPLGVVLAVIAATFALRVGVYQGLGLTGDPWAYRFFPMELGLFLAGTVSYHIYRRLCAGAIGKPWLVAVSTAYLLVAFAYRYLEDPLPKAASAWAYWGFFLFTTIALPFLFRWTEKNRLDRYIGELSFPLYLLHMLVLMVVANLLPRPPGTHGLNPWTGLACLVVATPLAMAMMSLFILPLDRFRHHLKPQDIPA